MAEAPPAGNDGIKAEVTCPVCLDLFKEPLLLPCMHTFCKGCLQPLLAMSGPHQPSFGCPQCRAPVSLPRGLGQLPKNTLAANIVANLKRSPTDRAPHATGKKNTGKEARRGPGPNQSQQNSVQGQLKKLQNRLEREQCNIADQQERAQGNLNQVARETAKKKKEVSDYFKKLAAQLQTRERELQQKVDASQTKASAVFRDQLSLLQSRMVACMSTLDEVSDLIRKNTSSPQSSLQEKVRALSQETDGLCIGAREVVGRDESPAHLQLSQPSLDRFCQGITLSSTRREETTNQEVLWEEFRQGEESDSSTPPPEEESDFARSYMQALEESDFARSFMQALEESDFARSCMPPPEEERGFARPCTCIPPPEVERGFAGRSAPAPAEGRNFVRPCHLPSLPAPEEGRNFVRPFFLPSAPNPIGGNTFQIPFGDLGFESPVIMDENGVFILM